MFVTRLLSGIVLVTAAVILLFFGDVWLAGALLILSQIGIFELLRVLRLIRHPMALVVYLETAAYYILLYLGLGWWTTGLLVLELVILLMLYVIRYPRDRVDIVAKCLFVSVYVTLLLSFIYQTRCLPGGTWLVWLIIIASWGSDTCAYVVGVLIGRHHFSELSPKKTLEGCVGGVVGAALIGFGYACFFSVSEYVPFFAEDCLSSGGHRRRCDLTAWRPGGICDQEKLCSQGLWRYYPRSRRDNGPV